MLARKCSIDQLQYALELVNRQYDNNLKFRDIGPDRGSFRNVRFTLTVKDSSGKGARINAINGRRISAACWHAHGHFFEAVFNVCPDAVIVAGFNPENGRKLQITKDAGNWQDRNIGSNFQPVMFSEACKCNK